jgi:uncharacterized membrane protein YhaH (DUF805 family)
VRKYLFGWRGRLSRIGFARGMLLATIFADAGFLLACVFTMLGGGLGAVPLLLLPLAFVFQLALTVRRLHDRNKPGWWLVVFIGLPLLFQALAASLVAHQHLVGPILLGLLVLALVLGATILTLWCWSELLFLPGRSGPNRYGDDPRSLPAIGA